MTVGLDGAPVEGAPGRWAAGLQGQQRDSCASVGPVVGWSLSGLPPRVAPIVDLVAYRVLQEPLISAHKRATGGRSNHGEPQLDVSSAGRGQTRRNSDPRDGAAASPGARRDRHARTAAAVDGVDSTVAEANLRKVNVVQMLKGMPLKDALYGRVFKEGTLVA